MRATRSGPGTTERRPPKPWLTIRILLVLVGLAILLRSIEIAREGGTAEVVGYAVGGVMMLGMIYLAAAQTFRLGKFGGTLVNALLIILAIFVRFTTLGSGLQATRGASTDMLQRDETRIVTLNTYTNELRQALYDPAFADETFEEFTARRAGLVSTWTSRSDALLGKMETQMFRDVGAAMIAERAEVMELNDTYLDAVGDVFDLFVQTSATAQRPEDFDSVLIALSEAEIAGNAVISRITSMAETIGEVALAAPGSRRYKEGFARGLTNAANQRPERRVLAIEMQILDVTRQRIRLQRDNMDLWEYNADDGFIYWDDQDLLDRDNALLAEIDRLANEQARIGTGGE